MKIMKTMKLMKTMKIMKNHEIIHKKGELEKSLENLFKKEKLKMKK